MKTPNRVKDTKIKPQSKRLILLAKEEPILTEAGKKFLEAWRSDPKNTQLALVVSLELSDLGLQDKAIDLLHEFIQSNPLSKEILQVAAKIAFEIQAFGVAAKLYQQVIGYDPGDANSYELLVAALRRDEQYDTAINLLQEILPVFPGNARLWLSLGETLDHKNGVSGESKAFFEQAYELAPTDYHVLTTYANALEANTEAAPIYEAALAVNPEGVEANLGMAISEFSRGNLKKAWQHYEYRLDPSRNADEAASYQVEAPVWKGQPLDGKTLLVMAEQGIGDEVFFAANFQCLIDECNQLFIGCEPRLVSIFERSYPTAIVGAFEDKISGGKRLRSFPTIQQHLRDKKIKLDYAVSAGSSCAQRWHSIEDLPTGSKGYLTANPERVSSLADRCRPSEEGNLKVGISWQSGKLSKGRKHSYPGLEGMLPLLNQPGIDFFILQYSYEKDVIDSFTQEHGISLYMFGDIDLKADIEANLAIMEHMDLVVGPPIATQSFAMALGKPVFLVCDGFPWSAFGQSDGRLPVYKNARAFPKIANSWGHAYDQLRGHIDTLRSSSAPSAKRPSCQITQVPKNWVAELKSDFRENALAAPTPPVLLKVLDKYFAKLTGLKVGICWDLDFMAHEDGSSGSSLPPLISLLEKRGAEIVCLHPNVNRTNCRSYAPFVSSECHFLEDFDLFETVSYIQNVFDRLDMIIGPDSFITLTALMHGTKTMVVSDGPGWDLTNDRMCIPLVNPESRWFDFRPEFQDEALEEILTFL